MIHHDENRTQGEHLADFHTDIERDQVRNQSIGGHLEIENFRREAESVEEPEDQGRSARIGCDAEPGLECSEIVECLVHHRQSDHRVDQVRIDTDPGEYAKQQRRGMAHGEQCHIQRNVLQSVQEKNHAQQKQQMIVSGDHVLGPEIRKRNQQHTTALLYEPLVTGGDAVRQQLGGQAAEQQADDGHALREPHLTSPRRSGSPTSMNGWPPHRSTGASWR